MGGGEERPTYEVPEPRVCEAGVSLLDARELGDLLEVLFNLALDQLDLLGVRANAIALHHRNVPRVKV